MENYQEQTRHKPQLINFNFELGGYISISKSLQCRMYLL